MLVLSTQATAFATTCYLVAARAGGPCLVVDAGAGSAGHVEALARRHDLRPVAVAATHGHPDHLWDAAAVCDRFGVPFLLHEADHDRLADPAGTLGAGMGEAFAALAGGPWRRPRDVRPLTALTLADLGTRLDLTPVHAPGHTPGSTVLLARGALDAASVLPAPSAPAPGDAGGADAVAAFTGDVLFAGSIGRVDLPGGDGATMLRTLRGLPEAIPGHAVVLPGHGPRSTLRRELDENPYLDPRWLASGVL